MIDAPANRKMFATAIAKQLELVGKEQRTKKQALTQLRKLYDKMLAAYLRAEGTTYEAWETGGPKPLLDEVLAAATDDAVWDRLVERYETDARAVAP